MVKIVIRILILLIFVGCTAQENVIDSSESSGGGLVDSLLPELHFVNPASPSSDNTPNVEGKAKPNSSVSLYSDSTCSSLLATGAADTNGNYSITVTVSNNTTTNIYAKAVSGGTSSGCTTQYLSYVHDSDGPLIIITGPAANASAQTGLTLTGTCQSGLPIVLGGTGLQSPSTGSCTSDAFSIPVVFTAGEGAKNISVTQTDFSSNSTSDNRTFIRDNTVPAFTVASPANSASVGNPFTITGACENGLTIALSGTGLSSPTTGSCSGGLYNISVTATAGDGIKQFSFSQTDGAGNSTSVARTLTVDTVYPIVTISSPANNSYITSSTFTLSGTCDDTLTVDLSGAGLSSPASTTCAGGVYSESITVTAGQGSKVISVSQTDSAGNTATASRTYVLDSIAPTAPFISTSSPVSPSSSLAPTLTGAAEANSTVRLYSDSSCTTLLETTTANGSGVITFNPTITANVTNPFYVRATDTAGNVSNCSASAFNYVHYNIGVGIGYFYGANSTTDTLTPTNVNQTTAFSIAFPNSRFDDNYYTHDRSSNSHLMTMKVAGNYLLSFNLPINGALTNGAVSAEVYVNGTLVPGTLAASSFRSNVGGHAESSLHLTTLLRNLNVNDQVDVRIVRRGAAGTLTLDEGNLYLEYVGVSRTLFAGRATQTDAPSTPTNFNQATAYSLQWTEDYKTSGFTHDDVTNPQNITLDTNATYAVSVNIPVTSAISYANVRVLVQINGVTITNGQAKQGVIRNAGGHTVSSIHYNGFIYNAPAGGVLTVKVQQEGAAGTVTVPVGKAASIVVERFNSTSKVYAGTGTTLSSGTDWGPAAAVYLRWTTDSLIDGTVYTHSTATNPHLITVLEAGDYLVTFNTAVSGATANINTVMRIEVNGALKQGAITKTFYISNTSAHTESSGTFVFLLKGLAANDVIRIATIREGAAGTMAANPGGTLLIQKKD